MWKWKPFSPLFIDVTTSKGIFNTESHTPSQTHKQTVTNGKAESNSQSSHNWLKHKPAREREGRKAAPFDIGIESVPTAGIDTACKM